MEVTNYLQTLELIRSPQKMSVEVLRLDPDKNSHLPGITVWPEVNTMQNPSSESRPFSTLASRIPPTCCPMMFPHAVTLLAT